jgi:4'-phosphopantetheinyl transferase
LRSAPSAWSPAIRPPRLKPGDVHVWRLRLTLDDVGPWRVAANLSPAERQRRSAFFDVRDGDRWAHVRGVLRELLGAYTGEPPASLHFALSGYGRPVLPGRVSFSVAHTGGLALYAVARDIEVGIDVERIDPARASLLVADAFLSAAESERLRTCRDDVRAREFFRIWTRREALIKARGTGWFDESSSAEAEGETSSGWWLRELPLGSCHASAVAGEGEARRVLLFDLEPRLREGSPYTQRKSIEARSEMLSHSRLHSERETPIPAGDHLPS